MRQFRSVAAAGIAVVLASIGIGSVAAQTPVGTSTALPGATGTPLTGGATPV